MFPNTHHLSADGPGADRRGGVLVMALIAVLAVLGFGASFLAMSASSARRQVGAVDGKQAFYLADAGLAEAYRGLCIGKTGAVGTRADPAAYGDGLFWVEATDAGDGRVALQSTGMVGSARVVLSLVVEPGELTTAALAVFTGEDLTLVPGTRIDSYDSRKGAYADQRGADADLEGVVQVGSNGDVSLSGTADDPLLIRGDVRPGPAKTLSMTDDVYVSGDTSPAPTPQVLPPVQVPGFAKIPGVDHAGALPLVVPPGEHGVDYLHVQRDAEVVLQGPSTVVLGGLKLAGGAQLTVDTTTGAVEVFVEDYLMLERGSVVQNTTRDPGALAVQYAGTAAASLQAAGALEAVVYAPLAQMLLGRGAEIFGSLVGKELTFTGPAAVHFDRALLESSAELSLPRLMTWRIVERGETGGGVLDPFQALGVDPAACAKPAEAHEDQMLDIAYLDLSGVAQTYNGWESAFDWTQVGKVTSCTRDGAPVEETVPADPDRPLTPTEQATVDYMKEVPAHTSAEIKTRLMTESPLSVDVLVEAVRIGLLSSADLKDVLVNESPLDPAILTMILDGSAPMAAVDKNAVMAAQ